MAALQPPLPLPKQLRFVNNQGQPPSKRRRINAACLTCRRRKTRCAGERPACSTCQNNGHKCMGYINEKRESEDHGGVQIMSLSHAPAEEDVPEVGPLGRTMGIEPKPDRDICDRDDVDCRKAVSPVAIEPSLPEASTPSIPPRSDSICVAPTTPRPESDQRTRTRRLSCLRSISLLDGNPDPKSQSPTQPHPDPYESHRVPYFRYFGPTAIVPGYKQMVVNVSVRDRRRSRGSFSASSPGSSLASGKKGGHGRSDTVVAGGVEDLPPYDPADPEPVHPLIMKLLQSFFLHLGCNFPFLNEARVLRLAAEKRVQPILVDSMCALAARFSDPLLTITNDNGEVLRCSQYGDAFSQRAKAATVDTFPCPTVSAVQAFIIMAYEGFGADQDSTLWMYLGIAIRMAVDLGLQKMVGIQCQGGTDPLYTRELEAGTVFDEGGSGISQGDAPGLEELRAVAQERVDTFWSVFFVDRAISSGTGRPVTFRDDDFELALPEPVLDPTTGWPAPFPTLVQIIHIYGRVSDVLNNVRNAEDLTRDKMRKLAQMENELTQLYQRQDPRLHFNAANFQQYVRDAQGTTFLLVHFWFHALIIILHQPTLLAPFGGLPRDHQLLSNSHVLAMSSAKTIADILAFAELIDQKSFIGTPFTSQPIYIAACAFLMESVANASAPNAEGKRKDAGDAKPAPSKHALLVANVNQNYQRCYKSLQQMEKYWGGMRYILTALDQKAKGIWDCETFTSEEYESTKLRHRRGSRGQFAALENPNTPHAPPIGWSLTGNSNSSSPSLTLLFQNQAHMAALHAQRHGSASQDLSDFSPLYTTAYPQAPESAVRHSAQGKTTTLQPPSSPSMGNLSQHKHSQTGHPPGVYGRHNRFAAVSDSDVTQPPYRSGMPAHSYHTPASHASSFEPDGNAMDMFSSDLMDDGLAGNAMANIVFDSQEIDIGSVSLPGEVPPQWLYLPGDITNLFDNMQSLE